MYEKAGDNETALNQAKQARVAREAEKMLNGRAADNALLDNIAKKGANSYYYAHAPKDFTVEGAKHFEGDGKIYGGAPVLIASRSAEETQQEQAVKQQQPKRIEKFGWADETKKVKIYVDFAQFRGGDTLTAEQVQVDFGDQTCEVRVVDQEGTLHCVSFK